MSRFATGLVSLFGFIALLSGIVVGALRTDFAAQTRALVPFDLPVPASEPIVVVGAGLAGLSAAIEAARNTPRPVILLEKTGRWGGNSAKASSGINGVGSMAQASHGVTDSVDVFVADTLRAGGGANHLELVRALGEDSAAAISFLEGMDTPLDRLAGLGGHSAKRTHRPSAPPAGHKPMGAGAQIVWHAAEYARGLSNLEIRTEHPAASLVHGMHCDLASLLRLSPRTRHPVCARAVTGVRVAPTNGDAAYTISAAAVIVTTGGYAQSPSIMGVHAPQLSGLASTNGPWSSGDGLRLAADAGAELIQLENVQIHPTAFVDPVDPRSRAKVLAAEALRGVGGVLVDHEGKRFTNELKRRGLVSADILAHCAPFAAPDAPAFAAGGKNEGELAAPGAVVANTTHTEAPHAAFMLMNQAMVDDFGVNFNFYWKVRGFFTRFENAEAAALAKGWEPSALVETLERYAAHAVAGADADFGRPADRLVPIDPSEPVYVAAITPGVHYTMGGVRVDADTRATTADGVPVLNLFAAGEVIGGLHGRDRLGGNSLLDCVVFGRRAAAAAVANADRTRLGLPFTADEMRSRVLAQSFGADAVPTTINSAVELGAVCRAAWSAGDVADEASAGAACAALLGDAELGGSLSAVECSSVPGPISCSVGGASTGADVLEHLVVRRPDELVKENENPFVAMGVMPLCHGDAFAESVTLAARLGLVEAVQSVDGAGELRTGAHPEAVLAVGPPADARVRMLWTESDLSDATTFHLSAPAAGPITDLAVALTARKSILPRTIRLFGREDGLGVEAIFTNLRSTAPLMVENLLERTRRALGDVDMMYRALMNNDLAAAICGRDGRLVAAHTLAERDADGQAGPAAAAAAEAFLRSAAPALADSQCSATLVYGDTQLVAVISCRGDSIGDFGAVQW